MQNREPQTLVVGLGKTGMSVVRFLHARGGRISVTDTRDQPPGLDELRRDYPDVDAFVGGFRPQAFEHAKRLVVSPGVDLAHPLLQGARRAGIELIGDIELFARARRRPVVAITGTNGKSTVTEMVGAMARRAGRRVAVGGNIGAPALNLLDIQLAQGPAFYVLELSSFQLELTESLNAEVAVVLNLTPDHLDRHQTMDDYMRIKNRILHGKGVGIINAQDMWVRRMDTGERDLRRFVLLPPKPGDFGVVQSGGQEWLARGGQALMPTADLRLPGRHNVANALAALAIGDAVRLDLEPMLETLRGFKGLPHRTQWVAEFGDVDWYNDSKATNVGATEAAVRGFPGKLILIAGGEGKNQDFKPLAAAVRHKVRNVVLLGKAARAISNAIEGEVPVLAVRTMAEAVLEARRMAHTGDHVLLSPACASFDMYANFEERGKDFVALVEAMKKRYEDRRQ